MNKMPIPIDSNGSYEDKLKGYSKMYAFEHIAGSGIGEVGIREAGMCSTPEGHHSSPSAAVYRGYLRGYHEQENSSFLICAELPFEIVEMTIGDAHS
jgi:hypothetical protein